MTEETGIPGASGTGYDIKKAVHHEGAIDTAKKTIYIREADEPLWEQAEKEAGRESLSGLLNVALKNHLTKRPAGPAEVWLKTSGPEPLSVQIEPEAGGWQIRVPRPGEAPYTARAIVLHHLGRVIGIPNQEVKALSDASDPLWVWIPADSVAGILWRTRVPASGIDYHAKAREAWTILRERAQQERPLTYGDLGHRLGGLHPLHDVPEVLDIIQSWCRNKERPDLTGLVVSQRTGLPGRDYWRQNGWSDLPSERQEALWRDTLAQLRQDPGPESPPF